MLRIMWCRKALASNSKCQRQRGLAVARDRDAAQVLHRRARLAGRGAEGAEVVLAQQQSAAGPHRIAIERMHRPADPAGIQARPHRRLRAARRHSGAPRRWRGNGTRPARAAPIAPRCRGGRKRLVPRTQENGARSTAVSKCTTCIRRVDAGIGAAGAERGDRLRGELRERRFQLVLHGAARELALPALVGLSVVADAERQPHGGIGGRAAAQRSWPSSCLASALRSPRLSAALPRPASGRLRRRRAP